MAPRREFRHHRAQGRCPESTPPRRALVSRRWDATREFQAQPELQAMAEVLGVDIRGSPELTAGNTHVRIAIHVVQGLEGIHLQLEPDSLGDVPEPSTGGGRTPESSDVHRFR